MTAVIYARFSPRRNEDTCESNETQIELCEAYCKQREYAVGGIFQDRALSGGTMERPGLFEAVDALCKGDVLVVRALDRLSRGSVLDSCLIEQDVHKAGATIESIAGEGTWDDSPESELIRTVLRGLARYARLKTAARTKAAMLRHQRNGRRMSAKIVYGQQIDPADPARTIPHEGEQAAIRRIVELADKKYNPRHIARVLASEGLLSRAGKRFSHSTVGRILKRSNGG